MALYSTTYIKVPWITYFILVEMASFSRALNAFSKIELINTIEGKGGDWARD